MTETHDKEKSGGLALHTKILVGLLVGITFGLAGNLLGARLVSDDPGESRFGWIFADEDKDGIADGVDFLARDIADPVGKIFLRLVLMVVLPLVISALALGVVGIGDVRRLGRVGIRTLFLTALLSSIAVVLGVALVNMLRPGYVLSNEQRTQLQAQYSGGATETLDRARKAKVIKDILLDIIPENPVQEMAGAVDGSSKGNGMLAVMFFALVLGVAMTTLPDETTRPLVGLLEAMFAVSMAVVGFAMRIAPYAVACLTFAISARLGLDILNTLLWFVITVLIGLGIHMFVMYSLLVRTIGGMSPMAFFRGSQDAIFTAFGTSSSNATLPTAMRVAEEDLKLSKDISNFVLTVGATGNQNGTALYEGVVVLFLAQVFGVELSLTQQVVVVLMSVLAGIGTAGVPGGSLPMIVIVLQTVGVPGEGIGIILGIDRVLDMCRTVLNVTGDLALAACVSNWERRSGEVVVSSDSINVEG